MPVNVKIFLAAWELLLLLMGGAYVYMFYRVVMSTGQATWFDIACLLLSAALAAWHIFTALGLMNNKRWAYRSWRGINALFLIVFPIGTLISYGSRMFTEAEEVGSYFQKPKLS